MNPNIIWIASYPKSGNTMLRAFLASYFYTKDGLLKDFSTLKSINAFNNRSNYESIENFPKIKYFQKNPEEIHKYWQIGQENIKKSFLNKIIFLKTHNAQIKFNKYNFTNNLLTKCFIYIVRDPRSVLLSTMSHYGHKSQKEAKEFLISDKHLTYATTKGKLPEFILSWKSNFISWQNFYKLNPKLGYIIKYEDLILNREINFYNILEFICNKIGTKINTQKFENALKSTSFKKLKLKEEKNTFDEKSDKAKSFFRSGLTDEWINKLDKEIILEINDIFKKEMKYLKYI